tara:strand:+ start:1966 stop:2073 length:108 start_codon:yes stop_codon:yes gene_type:complete
MRGIPFFYVSQENMLLDGAEMAMFSGLKNPHKKTP